MNSSTVSSKTKAVKAKRRHRIGQRTGLFMLLFFSVAALVLIGMVMGLSVTAVPSLSNTDSAWSLFIRHAVWFCVGTVVLIVMLRIDYHLWKPLAPTLIVLSFVSLAATMVPVLGSSVNGAQRWISFGPITWQPSETAKLALVVFIADLLSRSNRSITNHQLTLRPALVVTLAMICMFMMQPHLGGSMMVAAIVIVMLWFAGVKFTPLLAICLAGIGSVLMIIWLSPWRRARLFAFLNPWEDPSGNGYQPLQSLHALASGGLDGVGLGEGRSKWGFLPYAHTDFIFAVIGEELGLLGTLLVVLLFTLVGVGGFIVAIRASDRFGMLLAAGITAWVSVQAVINMGAVVAVFPVVGITLPLLSFGGSSLVTTMAAMGLLMNIARQVK